jgi:K+-sensing histidine kinase KdpD
MTANREDEGRLLSFAVHELRTPMTVVAGYLRMVLKHYGESLGEGPRKLLQEADKSCGRLAGIVAELSDLAHLWDGRASLASEPIDFFALLAEVAEGVHEGRDRGVRLELGGPGGHATVFGDPPRLREALTAILTATLREYVEPGPVLLRQFVERGDGVSHAVVRIGGDGGTLLAADAERWEPFNEYRGGLGFSLQLARVAIEHAGGTVRARHRDDPRAEVLLVLPAKESEA